MNSKLLIWIIVASLISPCICFGQNSWNMELIGHAGFDGSFRNYEAFGDFLYIITNKVNPQRYLLSAVDISNPTRPNRLGVLSEGEIGVDLIVVDSLLYVTSHDRDSIFIYSLQDPSWPLEVARIGFGEPIMKFDRLNENLIGSPRGYTYGIIDIQDRLNPQLIVNIDLQKAGSSGQLYGDYLYIGEYEFPLSTYLEVFDISDILNPFSVYFADLGFGYMPQIKIIDNYLYITRMTSGIGVFDITVPSNPVFLDSVLTGHGISELEVMGDFAAMVGYLDSLLTVDISDPTNPLIVGASYNQGNSGNLHLSNERAYFVTEGTVISYFDISNPLDPVLEGRYIPGIVGRDIGKWGNYAYLSIIYGGFRIVDISDPTDPVGIGYYETDYQTMKLKIFNGILYLADSYAGVKIISLMDPLNPESLSTIFTDAISRDVFLLDSLLYIACDNDGFWIADVSDLMNPILIGEYPSGNYHNYYRAIIAYDNYVYTGEADSGLGVYDASDPTNPFRVRNLDAGYVSDLFIRDTILYVADFFNGLSIFNIADPSSPNHISTTPPSGADDVHVDGNIAYLTYMISQEGVKAFDITNLYAPLLIGTYEDYGFCNGIVVENDTAYVSAGDGGLWILRYESPTDITNNETIIPSFGFLNNYPNPFNASTVIEYSLPAAADVIIVIYDILGRRVETLVQGEQPAGYHQVIWDASDQSSGVYFYRIQTGKNVETKKMVLLK